MTSSSDESNEDSNQRQRRHSNKRRKKSKKKDKKKRHRDNDYDDTDNTDNERQVVDKRRKKKHKSHHRSRSSSSHHRKRHRGEKGHDYESYSSSGSDSSFSEQSQEKKKRRNKRRRKLHHRNDEIDDKDHSRKNDSSSKYSQILSQLHNLLSNHPDLASELPYLLIRMCSGSSISLTQMPDPSVSSKLYDIFKTLGCTMVSKGEFIFDDGGRWKSAPGGDNDEQALVLVKLIRYLMNNDGLTIDAVQKFEAKQQQLEQNDNTIKIPIAKTKALEQNLQIENKTTEQDQTSSLMTMLLETFQPENENSQSSSLAKELQGIIQIILDGEIICLDGLEDEVLKQSIEKFFLITGLVKEEMDNDDEEEDDGDEDQSESKHHEITFGYTLPLANGKDDYDQIEKIKAKLMKSIETAENFHHKSTRNQNRSLTTSRRAKIMGPSLPQHMQTSSNVANDSDDDSDEGPAPFGSSAAKVRVRVIPPPSVSNDVTLQQKREEWMIKPGEHNFLKGVMSSGTIRSRKFKNEKSNASSMVEKVPVNPEIQRKIDTIMDAHHAARGPSLVDQHREKIAEEKAAKAAASKAKNEQQWNWSKKDLDADRRVDKKYLNLVMGGATKDLKNKFQGSYSTGFT